MQRRCSQRSTARARRCKAHPGVAQAAAAGEEQDGEEEGGREEHGKREPPCVRLQLVHDVGRHRLERRFGLVRRVGQVDDRVEDAVDVLRCAGRRCILLTAAFSSRSAVPRACTSGSMRK